MKKVCLFYAGRAKLMAFGIEQQQSLLKSILDTFNLKSRLVRDFFIKNFAVWSHFEKSHVIIR
nr:MAG TPA: hypothetical protein [Caudoviricetes sp.]